MEINYYSSWTQPCPQKTIAIKEWLGLIKHSDFTAQILKGRNDSKLYDEIKSCLPCVTYNFLFHTHKKNQNIIGSTGFLYIDIDSPEFEVRTLDRNKVYSLYHSYGGVGYSMIVKVEGLNFNNFEPTYLYVCNELRILPYVDKNAIKATQFNVLSYDPQPYINENSYTFSAVDTYSSNNYSFSKNKSTFSSYTFSSTSQISPTAFEKNKNITYTNDVGVFFDEFIRYNNLNEFEIKGNYETNWDEGFAVIKASIPYRKLKDKRKRCLLSYTANLTYLNPVLTHERLLNTILKVNILMCEVPLELNVVQGIVKSIYQQKIAGKLQPRINRRRIVFSKDCCLNGKEKSKTALKLTGEQKVKKSKQTIYDLIEAWDFAQYGKITGTKICELSPLCRNTVDKYYKEFKSFVQHLNAEFKSQK
jgi:hypothetical protein